MIEYLTNYVGDEFNNMIEDNTTWYLGTVASGSSYKLAKYTNITDNILTTNTTTAKVGLLRSGELMAGQFARTENNTSYWLITPSNTSTVRCVADTGGVDYCSSTNSRAIQPAFNLKSNVIITSGNGTKENPFTIALE